MRIQNQQPIYSNQNPHFTSSTREVHEGGKLLYRNVTHYFRDDIKDWHKYTDFILDEFKESPVINLYSIGSSKCDELFGTLILLKEKLSALGLNKKINAFAVDLDEAILNQAKGGETNLNKIDVEKIKRIIGPNYKNYFEIDNNFRTVEGEKEPLCKAKINPQIINSVKYINKDAISFVNEIEPENSFVMARNFWPYLSDTDRIKLSENLGTKLQKNSFCILGEYDIDRCSTDALLLDKSAGFDLTDIDYVYKKIHNNTTENNLLSNPDYLKSIYIKK